MYIYMKSNEIYMKSKYCKKCIFIWKVNIANSVYNAYGWYYAISSHAIKSLYGRVLIDLCVFPLM